MILEFLHHKTLSKKETIFANLNDERVGIATLLYGAKGKAYIKYLSILKKLRRKGLGKEFAKHLEDYLKNKKNIKYLYLLPADDSAAAFWKKIGFDKIIGQASMRKVLK